MRKAIVLSFYFITSLSLNLFAQGIDFEDSSWADVREKASEEDKIIFVDAYAAWCGPCKMMAKNVFTDESVGEFYNENFVNFKLDMEKGEGIEFAEHYGVRAYPTLLFISASGDIVHQSLGALDISDFIRLGEDALSPETRMSVMKKAFNKGNRDPEFLRTYLMQTLKAGYDPSEVAEAYFTSLPEEEFVTEENFELIQMLRPGMHNPLFSAVLAQKEDFMEEVGEERVNQFLGETCKWDLMRTAYKGSEKEFELKIMAIEHLDLENADEILTYGELYYAQREDDTERYIEALKKYSHNFASDWKTLNTLAWEIYENEKHQSVELNKIGLKMARQSIDMNENYYNVDTYAALLFKLGKYKQSRKYAEEAIELAKLAGEDYSVTLELLEKLEAAENR